MTNTLRKFDELVYAISEFFKGILGKDFDKHTGEFLRAGRANLTQKELVIVDSFQKIAEIDTALQRIELIEKLARVRPPKRQNIDNVEYLKFLIEAYFQELYIIEERVGSWLKWHERKTKKSDSGRAKFRRAQNLITDGFKFARKIRGVHVHEARYSTEELDTASGYSLIARTRTTDVELARWEDAARMAYIEARRKFQKKISSNHKAIRQLLDLIAAEVSPIVIAQLRS